MICFGKFRRNQLEGIHSSELKKEKHTLFYKKTHGNRSDMKNTFHLSFDEYISKELLDNRFY